MVVGSVVNGLLYLAYIGLTHCLLEPRAAMTVVYVAGVIVGFIGHKSWTFAHSGRADRALLRYLGAYALGYLINLAGLEFGISVLQVPHELAQAAMIVVVATAMFMMQKYMVFAEPPSTGGAGSGNAA